MKQYGIKYFSDEFLSGLSTKSQGFQKRFQEIMDDIDYYFDEEDEIKNFHEYIESQISYVQPGNMLYSAKIIFGEDEGRNVSLGQEIAEWFFSQFNEEEDAFQDANHFIIGIRCKEGGYSEKDELLLRTLIGLRRMDNKPEVVMIKNDQKDEIYATCFMAALK